MKSRARTIFGLAPIAAVLWNPVRPPSAFSIDTVSVSLTLFGPEVSPFQSVGRLV